MRNKRKITISFVESGKVNNARLAEYFAERFKERGCQDNVLSADR